MSLQAEDMVLNTLTLKDYNNNKSKEDLIQPPRLLDVDTRVLFLLHGFRAVIYVVYTTVTQHFRLLLPD